MTAANIYLLIGGFRSATIYVAAKKDNKIQAFSIAAQILIVLGGIRTLLEF